MPNLTCPDGTVLGHSTVALTRMIGAEHGYYPADPIAAYNCDFLIDLLHDFFSSKNYEGPVFAKTDAERQALCAPWMKAWSKYLGFMDEFVSSGKKFLVGDSITIADFWVGKFYTDMFANDLYPFKKERAMLMGMHPNFKNYGERFKAEMRPYLDTRAPKPA